MARRTRSTELAIMPSTNVGLATALVGLEGQLRTAAERNIDEATQGSQYTALERQAMVTIEALRLVNGIDLAAVLLRGNLIRQIREQNLISVHPSNYATLEAMAQEQGIGVSEISDTITLCDIIFPYVENTLQLRVSDVWDQIGKSGFRELAPVLKAIITNSNSETGTTRAAVEAALSNAQASLNAQGIANPGTDDIRREAVTALIEVGRTVPIREIRRHLRPNGTPDIETLFIRTDGEIYATLRLSQEQLIMFNRLIGNHLNATTVPEDNQTRPVLQVIRRALGG